MALTVAGRVHQVETDRGVEGLRVSASLVRAFAKELQCMEVLGTATTDGEGRFAITAPKGDCGELAALRPDVVVEVRTPDGETVLATARRRGRLDGERREYFDIAISRRTLGAHSPDARPGYGARPERVVARVRDEQGKPVKGRKLLLISEHRPNGKRQRKVVFDGTEDFEVDVAPGAYSVQVFAEGRGVGRAAAVVKPGEALALDFALGKVDPKSWKKTDEQRLAVYGLTPADTPLEPLTLDAGQQMKLDNKPKVKFPGYKQLFAKNVDELKRFVGSKDEVFGHAHPRFGDLPVLSEDLTRVRSKKDEFVAASPEVKRGLERVADEYVYGNSKAVAQLKPVLDKYVSAIFVKGIYVASFFYGVVTINANSVLELGSVSTVLFASVLRIHVTGKLKIVGPCKVDVGRVEEFG